VCILSVDVDNPTAKPDWEMPTTMTTAHHQPIEDFLDGVQWERYVGATYAFAALRDGNALRNLACRLVLSVAPTETWNFSDDVDGLVIRRGWLSVGEAREAMMSLYDDHLVLPREVLSTLRDGNASYAWTRLMAGPHSRQRIGWRAECLTGLGESQYLFLGYEVFTQISHRLRSATKRPFDGWPNLAAFLGEGQEPVNLGDQSNTHLECFAPVYARIESESSLDPGGHLAVRVRCDAPAGASLRLLVKPEGGGAPRPLELTPDRQNDCWRSVANLPPRDEVGLTLMLGTSLADEALIQASDDSTPTMQLERVTPTSGEIAPARVPGDPPTLVDRWKRRAANNPVLAVLIILAILVIGAGGVVKAVKEIFPRFPDMIGGQPPEKMASPVRVKGSGTVIEGLLRPLSTRLKKGHGVLLDMEDIGSREALYALKTGSADIGAMSDRTEQNITDDPAYHDKIVIGVCVARDTVAWYVNAANPLHEIRRSVLARFLFSRSREERRLGTWDELGIGPSSSLARQFVRVIIPGRGEAKDNRGKESATVRLMQRRLGTQGGTYCYPDMPTERRTVFLHLVPGDVAGDQRALGLSTTAFRRGGGKIVYIVDDSTGAMIAWERGLWLYSAVDKGKQVPHSFKRLVSALLDPATQREIKKLTDAVPLSPEERTAMTNWFDNVVLVVAEANPRRLDELAGAPVGRGGWLLEPRDPGIQ